MLSYESPLIGKRLDDALFNTLYDATPAGLRVSRKLSNVFQRQVSESRSQSISLDSDVHILIQDGNPAPINPTEATEECKVDSDVLTEDKVSAYSTDSLGVAVHSVCVLLCCCAAVLMLRK